MIKNWLFFAIPKRWEIYRFLIYAIQGRMLFILNPDILLLTLDGNSIVSYTIEIELPRSGVWFKYFTTVDSLEEAEIIKQAAEGNVKARILKNA